MKQVTHTLKTGSIEVEEVPIPALSDKFVLVQTTASVISAGTEKTKIDMGKKNLLQKAKARPDLVRQVLYKLKTEGISKTFRTVNTRLASPNPLGYSSAGVVIAVGGLVKGIYPGDRVACAGAGYANHAELAVIPKNLIVRIPDNVSDEEAAFSTLGAIALQGVRLADPKLGETVLVLGLGLLGQITVQLLRANGCRVLGTDLDSSLITLSEKYGAIGLISDNTLEVACRELTAGYGVDAVIVCAGTSSNQPIELCGQITREKGRVVVVGAVRMDIPRENFFKKEISIVISRSYGPGRYDPNYEENGNDYPYAYVRFSEQRNMETILSLIAMGSLDFKNLITHRFQLCQADEAYALIEGTKQEAYLGIILTYADSHNNSGVTDQSVRKVKSINRSKIGISLIGAGNYATATLLPTISAQPDIEFRGLMTASGRTAAGVSKQFGFSFCTSKLEEIIDKDTDAVIIVTRHDKHADYVCQSLRAGKHVYVEKPLALEMKNLAEIHSAFNAGVENELQLMVGFNRRYAPLTMKVIEHFSTVRSPKIVNIRVNAGHIPGDHWIHDPEVGGGRVIGEACHFIDLAAALISSIPKAVHCFGVSNPAMAPLINDNVSISLIFQDGSIANIIYTSSGPRALRKEHIEVFGGGRGAIIEDFVEARFYQDEKIIEHIKLSTQDKGQRNMIMSWMRNMRDGKSSGTFNTIMAVSAATIGAIESMIIGQAIAIGPWLWDGGEDKSDNNVPKV